MKFKLVRDKIPTIIVENGQMPEFYVAEELEYERRLLDKMIEELEEFRDKPCIEEAADMYEVLSAICDHWGWSMQRMQNQAQQKRNARGGFLRRFILRVRDPKEKENNDRSYTSWGELL
jgi:predicted house-cleaning noncanonical NTP pyrophosphatase (MazG superfamily)